MQPWPTSTRCTLVFPRIHSGLMRAMSEPSPNCGGGSRSPTVARTSAPPSVKRPGRRRAKQLRRLFLPAVFIGPALVPLAVFRVWPVIEAARLSFTDWTGINHPRNIGLANYRELWVDENFRTVIFTNLKIVAAVPAFVLIPLAVAMILQTRIPAWRFFRSIFFFPALLSPIVTGAAFELVLTDGGTLNSLLKVTGLGFLRHSWLTDPNTAIAWVIIIVAWSLIGTGTVVFLGAMGAIDRELLDAARVDGASWSRVQRDVVFWQLIPIIELWTILVMIACFAALLPLVLTLTNGGPGYSTYTADFYIYQQAFTLFRSGYASAVSVAVFALTVVFLSIVSLIFRKARRT